MKRKMINSFFILSASSALSKLFSILGRMLLSRLLSNGAMTLYLLIMPTLSLCITIGQLGIPSAVFRLVTHPDYNNKKVIISAILLSAFSVIVMSISLLIASPYIANELLKNTEALYPILSFIVFIPLVSISGILKNFLLGKDHMFIVAKTQIVEEISRLLFIYLLLRKPLYTSNIYLVTIAYLSMSVGEFISIIYMLCKINYRYTIQFSNFNHNQILYKDILNISLPLTGSRLYHCFVNFLEPITLIYVLTKIGLQEAYIQSQYAIISGYVISLLVTPTFSPNCS
ncbi:MAG: oligosaccharide flippase family protein [Faecalibacillus sp.]